MSFVGRSVIAIATSGHVYDCKGRLRFGGHISTMTRKTPVCYRYRMMFRVEYLFACLWYSRLVILGGTLDRRVGFVLRGLDSNPTIFFLSTQHD